MSFALAHIRWFAALLALLLMPLGALAQGRGITVRAEVSSQRVYVGQGFALTVRIAGASRPAAPQMPDIPGMEVTFVGGMDESRSSTTIINGRRFDERYEGYAFQYEVVITRPGEWTIPSIAVTIEGSTFETDPIKIRVVPPQLDDDVKLWIETDNQSPFVGEPIRLRVTLGLTKNAARLQFTVPGIGGAFDLIDPEQAVVGRLQERINLLGADVAVRQGQRDEGGRVYTTFSAERIIIPRQAGSVTIGPATVDCEITLQPSRSLWDAPSMRRVVVPSNAIEFEIRELPSQGRPATFNGLIGAYAISASAEPAEVNVGDPIALEIRVSGPLVGAVQAPALEKQGSLADSFRITKAEPEMEMQGQTKLFRRTLRALSEDVTEIPAIELPYFDTRSGEYSIARSKPIPLKVRATRMVTAADAVGPVTAPASLAMDVKDQAGGIAFNYEGPSLLIDQSFQILAFVRSAPGVVLIAAPPAMCAAAGMIVIMRRRRNSLSPAQRLARALAEAREMLDSPEASADAPGSVSAAIRRCIGALASRPAEGLTAAECEEVIRTSRRADPQLAARVRSILDHCDAARYGRVGSAESTKLRAEALEVITALGPSTAGGIGGAGGPGAPGAQGGGRR